MGYILGIDLGTSSVKAMLMEEQGSIMAIAARGYDISIPRTGYAQQNPKMWYEKTVQIIKECLSIAAINPAEIEGISFSGQMHGLVCIDKNGKPLCPAIIWPDVRTKETIKHIYDKAGKEFISGQTQNTITTGFLIASLYWLYENDYELYQKIDKIMLPKDYIKYRLTGVVITDYSDAAGSLVFDNIQMCWSRPLIEKLELNYAIFPLCEKSTYIVGNICNNAAEETGLATTTKVVNGGSDQCMQGIGNGVICEGVFSCNIGTGGQISTSSEIAVYDKMLRTNTFAHAVWGRWNIMGACLSSGLSLKWLKDHIIGESGYEVINREGGKIPPGSEGLIFLPYLSGERTPHQNPDARGIFFGLSLKHNRYHMAKAVMEGVTYSLKDCMNVMEEMGLECSKVVASGGGANSELWLQMQADILEKEIHKSMTKEQACLGAVITAGVGLGRYSGYEEACRLLVRMDDKVYLPDIYRVSRYKEFYEIFKEIYRANIKIFDQMQRKLEAE